MSYQSVPAHEHPLDSASSTGGYEGAYVQEYIRCCSWMDGLKNKGVRKGV